MGKIEIRNLLVSECYTNCYLCKNKETGEGFIVDPGENELKISVNGNETCSNYFNTRSL